MVPLHSFWCTIYTNMEITLISMPTSYADTNSLLFRPFSTRTATSYFIMTIGLVTYGQSLALTNGIPLLSAYPVVQRNSKKIWTKMDGLYWTWMVMAIVGFIVLYLVLKITTTFHTPLTRKIPRHFPCLGTNLGNTM